MEIPVGVPQVCEESANRFRISLLDKGIEDWPIADNLGQGGHTPLGVIDGAHPVEPPEGGVFAFKAEALEVGAVGPPEVPDLLEIASGIARQGGEAACGEESAAGKEEWFRRAGAAPDQLQRETLGEKPEGELVVPVAESFADGVVERFLGAETPRKPLEPCGFHAETVSGRHFEQGDAFLQRQGAEGGVAPVSGRFGRGELPRGDVEADLSHGGSLEGGDRR